MTDKVKKQHQCDNCRHAMHMEVNNNTTLKGAKPQKVQFCTVMSMPVDVRVWSCDRVLNKDNNGK